MILIFIFGHTLILIVRDKLRNQKTERKRTCTNVAVNKIWSDRNDSVVYSIWENIFFCLNILSPMPHNTLSL